MKKLLLLLLLATLPAMVTAQTVRAVTEASQYTHLLDNGKVGGPATEITEATLRRAGLDYSIALYPWARPSSTGR